MNTNTFTFLYYSENETLRVPNLKNNIQLDIATNMASHLHWRKLKDCEMNIARLKGQLFMEQGKHRLLSREDHLDCAQTRSLLRWGSIDLKRLMIELEQMGITASVDQGEDASSLHVHQPNKALIDVRANTITISTAEENLAILVYEAIGRLLNGI